MSTTTDTVRVSGPEELLSIIPHLLGFQPENSVILVFMTDDAVTLTMRMDDTIALSSERDMRAAFQRGILHEPEAVAAVVWSENPSAILRADIIGDVLADLGVHVQDVLTVKGGRWKSALCTAPECCPPEGKPLPTDTIAAVEMVAHGSAPAASRDAAVPDLTPRGEAGSNPPKGDQAVLDAVERALEMTPEELAEALHSIRVRDAILWDLAQDGIDYGPWLDALAAATRASRPDSAAPAATTFALVAYLSGNGLSAGKALEVAIESDPDYSLSALLVTTISAGVPPKVLREALQQITREECLTGVKE